MLVAAIDQPDMYVHAVLQVGYMAGPLATIWDVYRTGRLTSSVKPPIWVILVGAVGLVIGLATYGYNVTRAMGVKLAKLTPTRGFAAELATAFIIMIASQYGLPTRYSTGYPIHQSLGFTPEQVVHQMISVLAL